MISASSRRPPLLRRPAAFLVVAALVASACGSSNPTASPSAAPSSSAPVASSAASASASASVSAAPSASASSSASAAPFDPYSSAGGGAATATLTYPARTVFVQLFEWRWTDVATECEQWLGPHGFKAVQVSPPNEHAIIDTAENQFPWWERYQAVSYKLESRSGTRAEFADMVKRCRAAGVDIYADVILNHMAAGDGTGSDGTVYTKYSYPGLYGPQDFHANPNPAYPNVVCDRDVGSATDKTDVQTCQLSGLADLRTEEPKVQETLASYLADLYGLGVRGFRVDAAKHIDEGQLAQILARFRAKIPAGSTFFVDQEITDFGTGGVSKSDYYPLGAVDDFVYTGKITAAFVRSDQTISSLQNLASAPFMAPSEKAVVFVDNHDTQRGHVGSGLILSYKRGAIYRLANVFMLAYPLGTPRLMSSYVFSDTEAGPPSDAQGHTLPVYAPGSTDPNCGLAEGQWVCEQRWHAIAGMVGFRDFTASSPKLTDWWSNPSDGQQIAFGRGSAGFVVINRSASLLDQTLHTSMAPGTYCDVVGGDLAAGGGSCTGTAVTVGSDGSVQVQLAPMTALAFHVGVKVR